MYNLIIKLKCAFYGYTNHIFVLVVTILDVSAKTIFGPKWLCSEVAHVIDSQSDTFSIRETV